MTRSAGHVRISDQREREEAAHDVVVQLLVSPGQLFAGYGGRNSQFSSDLSQDVSGWLAGGLLSWNVFDGFLTWTPSRERFRRTSDKTRDLPSASR